MVYTNEAGCIKSGAISHVCEINGEFHQVAEMVGERLFLLYISPFCMTNMFIRYKQFCSVSSLRSCTQTV